VGRCLALGERAAAMGKYVNEPIAGLATELSAGLIRLRRGYIDAAESLIQIIDPKQEYPYDFIVYRLTGYRPVRFNEQTEPMIGASVKADLQQLILGVCDSFTLPIEAYAQQVYDLDTLARKLSVTTKTIQRWRKQGLVARRLVFPSGRHRLCFLQSSVDWFVQTCSSRVLRAARFHKITAAERSDMLRRARRIVSFTNCSLNELSRHLAARTGRSVEAIRYTIRRFDTEHPDQAIFPHMGSPLDQPDQDEIYREFIHGVSVGQLARRYRRTRGSIYRVINHSRAQQLLRRPIYYIYSPQFDLPNAEQTILGSESEGTSANAGPPKSIKTLVRKDGGELPAYLRSLYDVPLLGPPTEKLLFRKYNFLKYQADKLRRQIDLNNVRSGDIRRIEDLLVLANVIKNRIIRSNLRLVVSIAKKHLGGPQNLFELISDGNVSLMRAVEKFDYSMGNRFSTYASWAIIHNYARSVPRERHHLDRFSTTQADVLDVAASLAVYDPEQEMYIPELRESIDVILARLSPLERSVLIDHYGLDGHGESKTLDQMGRNMGVSKERVRQIEIKAIKKLRKILNPQRADLMS